MSSVAIALVTATAYAASSGNFIAGVGGRPPQHHMKTRSRDQGRTAGVGSVKRPSPEFGAMGETRRKRKLRTRHYRDPRRRVMAGTEATGPAAGSAVPCDAVVTADGVYKVNFEDARTV